MFDLKEYLDIFNKDINAAKEYCLKNIEDIDAKCELILLDIDYFHENNLDDNFLNLEKLYKKTSPIFDQMIESALVYFYFDEKDFRKVNKYGSKFLSKGNDSTIEGLYYISELELKRYDAINHLQEMILSRNDLSDSVVETILNSLGFYYYEHDREKDFHDFMNKVYLVVNNPDLLARVEFKLATMYKDEDEEVLNKAFNNFIKSKNKQGLIVNFYIFTLRLQRYNPILVNSWLDKLEKYVVKGEREANYFYLTRGIVLYYLGKNQEAYEVLKSVDEKLLKNDVDGLNALGGAILYLGDKRLYREGEEALNRAIEINPRYYPAYNTLKWLYLQMHYYSECLEIIDLIESRFKEVDYSNKGHCLALLGGDFDEAFKLLKLDYKNNKTNNLYYNFYIKDFDKHSLEIFNSYTKLTTGEDYRQMAMMYFHGFGITNKCDTSKALEYALKGKELEPNRGCHNSVLGNIYLSLNEKEKAFELFKEGYDNYINYKERCACGVGFYCYCLMLGYGTNKDEEKAFEILNNFDFDDASDLVIYDYAYLCLKRKENLQRAYDLLLSVNEWRYDTGKYFLLVKVAKQLGRDYKSYDKKFKECLKHVPVREREHYLNNPEIFYLTNI